MRWIVFVFSIFALGTLGNCDRAKKVLKKADNFVGEVLSDTEFKERTTPVDADFVIDDINVYYKGKKIPFLANYKRLVPIWGKNYRKRDRNLYVWDDLGTYCHTSYFTNKITDIGVIFRNVDGYSKWTDKLYEKDIIIDGSVINKNTPVSNFNLKKKGRRFRKGPLPLSYEYSSDEVTIAGIKTYVHFSIGLNFEKKIRGFDVWVSGFIQ